MNVAVRRATCEDAPALARLMRGVYGAFGEQAPPGDAVEAFFRARLAPGGGLDALIAEDEDRGACGLLTLVFAPTTQGLGLFAWLDDFHVASDRRGCGVGTLLLREARAHASRRGAGEIRLSAEPEPGLVRLYREAGFAANALGLFTLTLDRADASS